MDEIGSLLIIRKSHLHFDWNELIFRAYLYELMGDNGILSSLSFNWIQRIKTHNLSEQFYWPSIKVILPRLLFVNEMFTKTLSQNEMTQAIKSRWP